MLSDEEHRDTSETASTKLGDDVVMVSESAAFDSDNASVQDQLSFQYKDSQKIGITGAVFLIINKMIGTGIFSTPSGIFAATGSIGVCLFLWVIGGILTFCGVSVFLEFGLAIPRSGGEKNYLERVYRHPKLLATCVLMSQMVLLGFSSGNSLAFGRYILLASGSGEEDNWAARGIGIACITFAVVLHSTLPKWGIRLFNVLGVFKVVVLVFIVFAGFAALTGHRKVPDPHNFDHSFRLEIGDGYGGGGAYAYATSILQIVYSYKGWENANYVLSEIKNPQKTLKVAVPLAVGGVTILYVLANVAYFAAIPKSDLAKSEVIVAGLFFRNVFGDNAGARSLPVFVALSNLGNVLAVSFAHSRLNQEFGKEGLLPYSRFWASIKPFNAPATALFLHWLITVIILVAPPAGPAYNFIVDLYTYPGAWINGFVAAGLIYLQFRKSENALFACKRIFGNCAIHTANRKERPHWVPVLCVSYCRGRGLATGSILLVVMDEGLAEDWRVQDRDRTVFFTGGRT
ncbi:MAG: hypothetical protein Q9214_006985 [Letrouitia sp. 1 TL-2023]